MTTPPNKGPVSEVADQLLDGLRRRHKLRGKLHMTALVLGAFGGVVALWTVVASVLFPTADTAAPVTGNVSIPQSTLASSFALDFVTTYLNSTDADRDQLARYITARDITLPAVRTEALDPAVVYVKQLSSIDTVSLWTVTISVVQPSVPGATDADSNAPARNYYSVPVSVTSGAPRAIALPARVSGPTEGVDVTLGYPEPVDESSQFHELVRNFLNAYLVDSADLDRFITVDSTIAAPTPSPYSSVSIAEINADTRTDQPTDGARAHLLVTVTARTLNYASTSLTYPLSVTAAGGHWMVDAIDLIPQLGHAAKTPETTTTTTSSTPEVPAPTRNSN